MPQAPENPRWLATQFRSTAPSSPNTCPRSMPTCTTEQWMSPRSRSWLVVGTQRSTSRPPKRLATTAPLAISATRSMNSSITAPPSLSRTSPRIHSAQNAVSLRLHGGRSSAGRALGCGPRCRGFEPRRSPHFLASKTSGT